MLATISGCGVLPAGMPAIGPTAVGKGLTGPVATEARPTIAPTEPPTPRPSATPRPAPTELPTAMPLPTDAPTEEPLPSATPTPAALAYEERRQIFEEVWRTVKEKYLYPDFHGLDWNAIHDEYGARLEQEQTRDQFYAMMVEMVARLDDQHSRFEPPSVALIENAKTSHDESTVGIGVLTRPRPDGAFIQIVFPDSPAARVELAPRDRIIAVDG